MTCSRRDLLRAGLVLGAGAVLGRAGLARGDHQPGPATLSLVEGSNPEKMVRRALELIGGADKFVSPGDRVVVKPNFSFANPADWGNNTNPEVVAAVCRVAREAGARKVSVVDYPLMKGAEAPKENGVAAAVEELRGVQLRVLSAEEEFRTVKIPGAAVLPEVAVSREVLDADVVINVPVAKAHDAVAASIGLKNLMGVIWDRTAFHTMMEINQAIGDLARAVPVHLTVVDMIRVMTTNGPKGPGEVATPNLVLASADPVAVDSFALTRVRFNGRRFRAKQLRYLRQAHQAGLGEIDVKKLTVHKEKV